MRYFIIVIICFFSWADASNSRVSTYTKDKLKTEFNILDLRIGSPIFMRSFKKEQELELWVYDQKQSEMMLFRTYPICKYSGSFGPKQKKGDRVAPEGIYSITPDSLNPRSAFHLSFDLGYPNAYDRYYGRTGSLLMVHGDCVSLGCYAMGNYQIEEIYYLLEQSFLNGQSDVSFYALPFRFTKENLSQFKDSYWFSFWQELKVISDYFDQHKSVPNVVIESGHYQIGSLSQN